ncbi:hypothetical protein PANT_7d00187 [Moesziomyces antarcticus T-34]|uniref:Uncharacterized protein n=1 Tax=Pseudozyma antarctica (strain T-34) TaxID=1151754 RepID=M9MBL2_PSEA3|nr:hypothetical protein PANT_7d00187 [Moesziomyces antarcticus T-34]
MQPAGTSSNFDAIRFRSDQYSTQSVGRPEPRLCDIPTPPHSETTGSLSGSDGRARKDSTNALLRVEVPSSRRSVSSQHLQPHHTRLPSAESRSPSVASSHTTTTNTDGSATLAATSPQQPGGSTFRSHETRFRPTMTNDPDAMSSARLDVSNGPALDDTHDRIRSSSRQSSTSPYVPRASSSLSARADPANSPGERRPRRSDMHLRDVTQIRSESRLAFDRAGDNDGSADHDDEADQRHPFPRTTPHKYSPRKSTSLAVASSRFDDGEARGTEQATSESRTYTRRDGASSPSTPFSARSSRYADVGDTSSGSVRRLARTSGRASARRSLDDRASPSLASSSRSPMPAEFRLPDKEIRRAYRAAHQRQASEPDDSAGSEEREELVSDAKSSRKSQGASVPHSPLSTRRDSLNEIREEGAAPRTHAYTSPRRRRYASDAAAEEALSADYEGRLGTQRSRISVDSASAQRYLHRASQHSTPSSSARRTPHSSDMGSPSEEARARKLSSTSSNRSQKSSSSASELHRAASRVGMRRQHGPDLFSDDAPAPATAAGGARAYSPSVRTEASSSLTTSSDRSRALYSQHKRTDDAAMDTLRHQIENLAVGRGGPDFAKRPPASASMRAHAQLAPARSSLDLRSPPLGSVRAQSVLGLHRSPIDALRSPHLPQHPSTDPQPSRYDRSFPSADPAHSSNTAQRLHDLVALRAATSQRLGVPQRSATAMGTAHENHFGEDRHAQQVEEPAPIRNLAVRLAQYEALYNKAPVDAEAGTTAGPHTIRTVELLGAIVRGTSTMWAELSALHPVATEQHLLGQPGDGATEAFGQLDEGLAFVNKLVLEQARAIQDLLFLLDRTEKERQAQFDQALVEMGHSPRPFSRIGAGVAEAGSDAHLLRRAKSSMRPGSSLHTESPSLHPKPSRGAGSAERGNTLTASQIRSMTSLGHSTNHARSTSELSPSSAAAQRRVERLQLPNEGSQDSPLASRRSVNGRPFPASEAPQMATGASAGATGTARAPLAFTPRRPRLSNPSISNATASGQPASAASTASASSVEASSPETLGNAVRLPSQTESEGSTIGEPGLNGVTDEFGRIAGGDALSPSQETVRLGQLRADRVPGARGSRIVDALASQLDTLRPGDGVPQRRHTMMHTESAADPSTSPSKPQPPPRPPRHIKRPSEEQLGSPARRSVLEDMGTPRQTPRIQQDDTSVVGSIGRFASRRLSRALGSADA